MSLPPVQRLTPEEYLAVERSGEVKHEFYDGQVFAMAGASFAHVKISKNIVNLVDARSGGCEGFGSDLRVRVKELGFYTYPDVVVVCGKPEFDGAEMDTLLNPKVIFEVLSPSTERYDRGRKFYLYQSLESLTDYVLVSQDMALVEHYARKDSRHWLLTSYAGLADVFELPSIQLQAPLSELYAGVELGPPPPLRDPV